MVKRENEYSPEDKLFLGVISPKTDGLKPGAYHVGLSHIVRQTGYNVDAVRIVLRRFEQYYCLFHFVEETGDIVVFDQETGEIPTETPLAEKRKEANRNLTIHEQNFEIIYDAYPLKKGKQKAFQRYHKLVTTGCKVNGRNLQYEPEDIYNAVLRYVEDYEKQNGKDYTYMKHFDTLMNNIADWMPEEGRSDASI